VSIAGSLPEGITDLVLGDPSGFVAAVADDNVMLCCLELARRRAQPQWRSFCADIMPLVGRAACAAVARQLAAEGASDALTVAQQQIVARTDANPGALAWLWRECAGSNAPPDIDPVQVAIGLLTTAAALVRMADLTSQQRKDRLNEVRSALFVRDGAVLRAVLEEATRDQLAMVKAIVEFNPGLTEQRRGQLNDLLRRTAPALFEKVVPPWEEPVIYTTEAGLDRRRAELEEIVHVRLPKVIEEIGQAAGFGDLSENAEYTAAVEERARLANQAARIQREIADARIIIRPDTWPSYVTLGTRVRLRNLATGREEMMTFLGPWDARPEQGIYAYNAPLGLAFMGRDVGEAVSFDTGGEVRRWEVLEVSPAV
jgi:transcription elongation GreA/GreB family factor